MFVPNVVPSELGHPMRGVAFERILSDIEARDEADRRRSVAPLKQLPDALLLDTNNLSIEEAVKKCLIGIIKFKIWSIIAKFHFRRLLTL